MNRETENVCINEEPTYKRGASSQLPGFYDPCMGEDKSLLVQYLFHNHVHEVMIQDKEAVRLPKNNHRVNPT